MRPEFDVNDNAQIISRPPTQEYKNLDNTSNTKTTIERKTEKERKDIIQICFLGLILIILLIMLIVGVKVNGTKDIGQDTFYTTDTNELNIYNVDMKVSQYTKENTNVNITLEITNNSKNDVYITAKGIYLTSQNNVYCPSVLTTLISSKFYGQPIKSNETVKAILTYTNVVDTPTTLVVSNIIDQENLAWTNAITIQ